MADARWQAIIGVYVDRFDPSDAAGTPLAIPPLWELAAQRGM
jgi:hypothetical protein